MSEMQNWSLAQLGSYFLDVYDDHIRDDDNLSLLEEAVKLVTDEIVRRVGADKVRHLMDFAYKAWADAKGTEVMMARFYEFKALTVAFDELKKTPDTPDQMPELYWGR